MREELNPYRLRIHKDPILKWDKCPKCKKGKVPYSMHAYWHFINKTSKDIFEGLSYKCPKCGLKLSYSPTMDITFY